MTALPEGCVLWPGRTDKDGYGIVAAQGFKRAHRLMYSMFVGAIPKGMHVLHSCDTPSCVNPRHLRVGTPADNAGDRGMRKRGLSGIAHPMSKLTKEQVQMIRSGMDASTAMATFGIRKSSYYRVRAGRSYAEVG